MRLTSDRTDPACGVLLGQACGDALGVPYEFSTPPTGAELAQMKGGGLGDYAPGEWSDDTQMAACIALVSSTGVDLTSTAARDDIADGFLPGAPRVLGHRRPDECGPRRSGTRKGRRGRTGERRSDLTAETPAAPATEP